MRNIITDITIFYLGSHFKTLVLLLEQWYIITPRACARGKVIGFVVVVVVVVVVVSTKIAIFRDVGI